MDFMQDIYRHFGCAEQAASRTYPSGVWLHRAMSTPLFDQLEHRYGPKNLTVQASPSGDHVAAYTFANLETRAFCRICVLTGHSDTLYNFILSKYTMMSGPLPANDPSFPRLGDWSYAHTSRGLYFWRVIQGNFCIETGDNVEHKDNMQSVCESLVRTLQDAVVPDYRRHVPDLTLSAEPEFNCWKLTLHCPAGFDSLTLDYFFVGAPYKVQKLGTGKYTVTIQQGIDYTPVPIAFYATDNASLLGRVVLFSPETGIVTPV